MIKHTHQCTRTSCTVLSRSFFASFLLYLTESAVESGTRKLPILLARPYLFFHIAFDTNCSSFFPLSLYPAVDSIDERQYFYSRFPLSASSFIVSSDSLLCQARTFNMAAPVTDSAALQAFQQLMVDAIPYTYSNPFETDAVPDPVLDPSASSAYLEELRTYKRSTAEMTANRLLITCPFEQLQKEALNPVQRHLPLLNLHALTPRQATDHVFQKDLFMLHKTRHFRDVELPAYDDDIPGRKEALIKFGELTLAAFLGPNWAEKEKDRYKITPSWIYIDMEDYNASYLHSEKHFQHLPTFNAGRRLKRGDDDEINSLNVRRDDHGDDNYDLDFVSDDSDTDDAEIVFDDPTSYMPYFDDRSYYEQLFDYYENPLTSMQHLAFEAAVTAAETRSRHKLKMTKDGMERSRTGNRFAAKTDVYGGSSLNAAKEPASSLVNRGQAKQKTVEESALEAKVGKTLPVGKAAESKLSGHNENSGDVSNTLTSSQISKNPSSHTLPVGVVKLLPSFTSSIASVGLNLACGPQKADLTRPLAPSSTVITRQADEGPTAKAAQSTFLQQTEDALAKMTADAQKQKASTSKGAHESAGDEVEFEFAVLGESSTGAAGSKSATTGGIRPNSQAERSSADKAGQASGSVRAAKRAKDRVGNRTKHSSDHLGRNTTSKTRTASATEQPQSREAKPVRYEIVVYKKAFLPSQRPGRDHWHGYVGL